MVYGMELYGSFQRESSVLRTVIGISIRFLICVIAADTNLVSGTPGYDSL